MSEPSPLISIVVAAYNVEPFIPRTLQSMLDQTLADWECVVVDDGSTDGTAAAVEAFAARDGRFRLVRQANTGPAGARNNGFGRTSKGSTFVAFMDSDDVWHADALATLAAAAEAMPGAVGAHGLADMIDAAGRPLLPGEFAEFGRRRIGIDRGRIIDWPIDRPTEFASVLHSSTVYPPGVLLGRRSEYERIGPSDENLPAAQDWDLLIRLARGGPIAFVNRVVLDYRRHGSNLSTQSVRRNVLETRYLHHKTFNDPANTPEQKRLVAEGWRAFQKYKMREKFGMLRAAIARAEAKRVVLMTGHLGAHAVRYARGYPTAKGV